MINIDSFISTQQSLDGIAPLDFFFAQALLPINSAPSEEQYRQRMLLMALSYSQRQGHSCLALKKLAEQQWWQSTNESEVKPGYQFADVETLRRDARDIIAQLPEPRALVLDDDRLYTSRYWRFEQQIMQSLSAKNTPVAVSPNAYQRIQRYWSKLFPAVEQDQQLDVFDWQQIAVGLAVYQRLLILTGGPGTGKTYTVARMLIALCLAAEEPLRIGLAAPTGKAANRLSESLQHSFKVFLNDDELAATVQSISTSAITMHRLLGLREMSLSAKYDEHNPLPLDVLIVDESSMLDVAISARLVRALPASCRLILVGDAFQLPAVESGNVLAQLVPEQPNRFSVEQCQWLNGLVNPAAPWSTITGQSHSYCVALQRSRRFGVALAELAAAVKDTNPQSPDRAWKTLQALSERSESNIHLYSYADLAQLLGRWVDDYFLPITRLSSATEALDKINQFRILCAVRQGEWGVETVNRVIEQHIRERLGILHHHAFHGQVVMVTKNLPALGLFNGDTGVVWQQPSGLMTLCFQSSTDNQLQQFDLQRITALESVFAMTIHKSQGSEFDHVAIVLPRRGGEALLGKELLYTAITRSQSQLSIVCDQSVINAASLHSTQRWSGLKIRSSL